MGLQTITIGALRYLQAPDIQTPHMFTTRLGGVSTGYLQSMNIGTHRGDDPENVVRNYEILASALDFDVQKLVHSKQTHTDIVRVVGQADWGRGLFREELPECDALVTNTPGTALTVFSADCTPILLWDSVTGTVGAAHAGWRGTASQIAAKTVKTMEKLGAKPENIRCAIGPNIGQCCFQTDADVPQAMLAAFGKEAEAFIQRKNQKYYVNLKELNALALRGAGVEQIAISAECTVCNRDQYWSHRVVGNLRGSQGAIIVCKEAGK